MKALIYSHVFWPSVGGVETYVRLLAEGIARRPNLQVTIVTTSINKDLDPPWNLLVLRCPRVWKLVREIAKSDVVLVAGPAILPMILSFLLRKPLVIEHHGYQAVCPNGLLLNKYRDGLCVGAFQMGAHRECYRCGSIDWGKVKAFRQILLTSFRSWICRLAASHIAITNHVNNRLQFARTEVIYYGIEEVEDRGRAVAAEQTSAIHFAYVGRLVGEKGLPLLIEAAQRLEKAGVEFRLTFVGDGSLRNTLEELIESCGLQEVTRFTGFLTGSALTRELGSVDVVVMPSVWEETAGLSAIEQMMRGQVVLAADIGGLGEVVGDAGMKFRPLDAGDLALKMQQLASSKSLRLDIGSRARKRAETLFTVDRMVDQYLETFKKTIARQG